jgi:hypothetical protein
LHTHRASRPASISVELDISIATMPGAAAVALNPGRAQERPEVCNQRVERPLIAA